MTIFQEEVLEATICRKCHKCDTEARKSVFESICSCEGTCISPLLAVHSYQPLYLPQSLPHIVIQVLRVILTRGAMDPWRVVSPVLPLTFEYQSP